MHERISKLAERQSYYKSCKFNYGYMEESFSQPKKLCVYWTLLNCIKKQNEFRVRKYIRDHLVQWFSNVLNYTEIEIQNRKFQ